MVISFKYLNESIESLKYTIYFHIVTMLTVIFNTTCQVDIDYSEQIILDQLVGGMGDTEILTELLGDVQTDRSLSDMVEYVARKEQARPERGTVSYEPTTAVKQCPSPPSKRVGGSCWACQGAYHCTNFKSRCDKCPAWEEMSCKGPLY